MSDAKGNVVIQYGAALSSREFAFRFRDQMKRLDHDASARRYQRRGRWLLTAKHVIDVMLASGSCRLREAVRGEGHGQCDPRGVTESS